MTVRGYDSEGSCNDPARSAAAQAEGASEAEWQLLVGALLASCSLAAARAWLGYVPGELQRQAALVIGRLRDGEAALCSSEDGVISTGHQCPVELLLTKSSAQDIDDSQKLCCTPTEI